MQRPGDDLLPAACFTRDDDCGRTLGNPLNLSHEVADHRAVEHGRDAEQDLGFGQLRHSGALYLNVNGQRATSYVGFPVTLYAGATYSTSRSSRWSRSKCSVQQRKSLNELLRTNL